MSWGSPRRCSGESARCPRPRRHGAVGVAGGGGCCRPAGAEGARGGAAGAGWARRRPPDRRWGSDLRAESRQLAARKKNTTHLGSQFTYTGTKNSVPNPNPDPHIFGPPRIRIH
jgi:hypothetical protein